jgi:hypothetical protein
MHTHRICQVDFKVPRPIFNYSINKTLFALPLFNLIR